MQLRLSDNQAQWVSTLCDPWIQNYLQMRYGRSWQWYWLNWQCNNEILF